MVRALLKLGWPTTVIGLMQAVALVGETTLVGRLGTDALAAYALVLPLSLLMGMMSTGAMGGGVTSALARTLGAGKLDEARALVLHALIIGLGLGFGFTVLVELFAEPMFAAMGARDAMVATASGYARLQFLGVPFLWLSGTLAALLRGAGHMRLPAVVLSVAWLAEPVIGWGLMFGVGPAAAPWIAPMGLPGMGLAYAVVFAGASLVLLVNVLRGGVGFAPAWRVPVRRELLMRILSVGAVASAMAALANLTSILVTAQVSRQGAAATAAYGLAVRLEFLMIPLSFGVGVALTSMVGHSVGKGDWERARRLAWTGGWMVFALCGVVGLLVGVWPRLWVGLFSTDPAVLAMGDRCLRIIAPAYAFLGMGMTMYFASQGAGRMKRPFVAAVARLSIAAGIGALGLGVFGWGLDGQFVCVAVGLAAFGLLIASGVRPGVWRAAR